MQGILGKLGNNFLIAAFIPALGFVVIAQLIFSPILPPVLRDNFLLKINTELEGISLLPLILTLLIGYTLLGLNTFIYKAIEGYYWPKRLTFLQNRQRQKAAKRKLEYQVIDKVLQKLYQLLTPLDGELNELKDKKQLDNAERRRFTIVNKRHKNLKRKINYYEQLSYEFKAQYRQDYPLTISTVLPTRFGNILRAAELYSNEHFGMDAVTLWPRLIYVIDDKYHQKLDESNNGLAFIANSMILAVVLSCLCLLASGYEFFSWQYALNEFETQYIDCLQTEEVVDVCEDKEFDEFNYLDLIVIKPNKNMSYLQGAVFYLILIPFLLVMAYFFYNATLPAARQYGNLIRSAYDLFRFDLTEQLRLELAEDSDDEHDKWKIWSEFVALGDLERTRDAFVYYHPAGSIYTSETTSSSDESS